MNRLILLQKIILDQHKSNDLMHTGKLDIASSIVPFSVHSKR